MKPRAPDKRSRLVNAAVKLIHEQGFERTTIAHIAEQADVQLGNVYYYFKTKDEIGDAVIEHLSAQYRELRERWDRDPDPRKRVHAFIQMTIDRSSMLLESGCPVGGLCSELGKDRGPTPLARSAASVLKELQEWLQTQFRALGRRADAREDAIHVLAVLQGATLLAHSFRSAAYLETEARRLQRWVRSLSKLARTG